MNQSVSVSTAILLLSMALLSFTSASRYNLQHDGIPRLDISKATMVQVEGRMEAEMVELEESAREVPTGPDPIHHHEIPKRHSAQLP